MIKKKNQSGGGRGEESHVETEAGWLMGIYSRSQARHSCTIPGKKQVLNQEGKICNLTLVNFGSQTMLTQFICWCTPFQLQGFAHCSKELQLVRNHCQLRYLWLVGQANSLNCFSLLQPVLRSGSYQIGGVNVVGLTPSQTKRNLQIL